MHLIIHLTGGFMALVFPRLARNFIKNGYFPTDEPTLESICSHFTLPSGHVSIFDPCVGEGYALDAIRNHLSQTAKATSYAVEYDEERAYHAKTLHDNMIHGDIQDCIVKNTQFGCLFLNPPYGDLTSDNTHFTNRIQSGRQRLEKLFFDLTYSSLVFGGVLVLIIPESCLDRAFEESIFRKFKNVQVFKAVERQFNQLVILGERARVTTNSDSARQLAQFREKRKDGIPLISISGIPSYQIPETQANIPLVYSQVDLRQMGECLDANSGIWPHYLTMFNSTGLPPRRPLCRLSDWHLALSVASGAVNGIVTSNDGKRVLLIKGGTHKSNVKTNETTTSDDDRQTTTITYIEKFVPTIHAIELTKGSALGHLFKIQ